MSLEANYGQCQFVYSGKGTITIDRKNYVCEFQVGQLTDGEIILLCTSNRVSFFWFRPRVISQFHGVTKDGLRIQAVGRISEVNYLPLKSGSKAKGFLALRLNEMDVRLKSGSATKVRFGLANFRFCGTQPVAGRLHLPLNLNDGTRAFNLNVIPVENYDRTILQISTLKGIGITCEAEGDLKVNGGINQLKKALTTLCWVMSVARGTKIQWVYLEYVDDAGVCIRRRHFARIAKPYCPMPCIDYSPQGRFETQAFLETGFRDYTRAQEVFKLGSVIDSFLDAKGEADYLETRGAKLAVVLEKLKSSFLKNSGGKAREFVISEAKFNKLLPSIQKEIETILLSAKIEKEFVRELSSDLKVSALNRKSFRYVVEKLCKEIGWKVDGKELQLFIACRNKLVHEGDFYCNTATARERLRTPPKNSPREEYYFMVNFLDRIFLKVLGYSGIYVNFLSHMTGKKDRELLA